MKTNKNKTEFDVIVVGAGAGGLTSAVGFHKLGKSVLLIEKDKIGGECTWSGCVPSKTLLHAAKKGVDGKEALQKARDMSASIGKEEEPTVFEEMGISVVIGSARFIDRKSVEVGGNKYSAKKIVIATGSRPRKIELDGLSEDRILTNENIFELNDIPKQLLIIGAGAVGLELGQAFSMLGSKVTIADINEKFGNNYEPEVATVIKDILEDFGVRILSGAYVKHAKGKEMIFEIKKKEAVVRKEHITFDKVLLSIGRVPNTEELDLEKGGILYSSRKGIEVNKHFRTSNRDVYAVGDITDLPKRLTHAADASARHVVLRTLLPFVRTPRALIPSVLYTKPEIASVGVSFKQAVKKYGKKRLTRIVVPFTQNDRAKTDDAQEGVLVIIAKRYSGRVLGAHIAGQSAGEIIPFFTLVIEKKISLWRINKIIFPYPTISLIIKKASDTFIGQVFSRKK